jgi:hypothetical protein
MSDETIMDMSLDTQTESPEDFSCEFQTLILSPHLTKLPLWFLYKNEYVKVLNISKCTNIVEIPDNFCRSSCVEHIIWPPNIESIQFNCLRNNICIQKIDLSYCNQLKIIDNTFCCFTKITDIILPASIQEITDNFCVCSNLVYLDLSYCINLEIIDSYFCKHTSIQSIIFPKFLYSIDSHICFDSKNVEYLDFSECKDVKINTSYICKIKAIKLYSIDNIYKHKIQCEDICIYNITKTRILDLTFIVGLQNVYLPEGEYCIIGNPTDYLGVKFWLRSSSFSAEYFSKMRHYSYIPAHEMAMLDTSLETV